jgi:WD40 repeat protein
MDFERNTASVKLINYIDSADGVTKIWHMKKSECVQSYSQHDGKLWALQTDPSNNEIITGGTDSTIIIWKDVTKETIEEENQVNKQMIQDQQSITSLMLCKEYADATKAAFKIGKRKECLLLIEKMAFSSESDCGIDCIDFILNHKEGSADLKLDSVKNTIKELKCINLKELIDMAKEYIVHIRYYKVSELIINCILESISKQDIVALGKLEFDSKKGDIGLYKIMEMMGEYSSKHLERVRRQIQKAHILKMVSQQLGISKSLE